MDHRVRNNLAALISLLRLGAEEAEEKAGGILREMADRVARLADVHNLSTSRGMQSIEVRELAEMIAKNVFAAVSGGGEIRWRVTGTPFRVPASRGATLALILNELLTNCVKHAFVGRAMGTVAVRVGYDGHEAEVEVQDDGVGLDLTRRPSSLGLTIVETLVTHNLQGSLQFMNQGGTRVSIRFPHQQEVVTGGAA
ncbi:MAG: hypothetical protein A2Z31_03755 [candidate division NC10 bacterium RBG_16_65_8]|nr:MAG: hypothetical protein A2Z31_03755 [candidate division NC10 bacterium RBG_16_65_8]